MHRRARLPARQRLGQCRLSCQFQMAAEELASDERCVLSLTFQAFFGRILKIPVKHPLIRLELVSIVAEELWIFSGSWK